MAAILLAGGRGSRLGGAEKAMLSRGGLTFVSGWSAALRRRDLSTVVVGPEMLKDHLPREVLITREDPPFTGPAAAVCAGVRHLEEQSLRPDQLLLLSVDTLDPDQVLDWLAENASAHRALIPCDTQGRLQMLTSVVDAGWLRRRVLTLVPGEEAGRPVRWLLEDMPAEHPVMPEGLGSDVDTAVDAQIHGVQLPDGPSARPHGQS